MPFSKYSSLNRARINIFKLFPGLFFTISVAVKYFTVYDKDIFLSFLERKNLKCDDFKLNKQLRVMHRWAQVRQSLTR